MKRGALTRLLELGADPADSPDERLRKKILVGTAAMIVVLAFVWVVTYAAFGLWLSAAIPASYQLLAVLSLAWFARTRRFAALRWFLLRSG